MTTATEPEAEVLTVDAAGHVSLALPAEFAGARITVERVSGTELRIRVATSAADGAAEEPDDGRLKPLSVRDAEFVANLMENPPEPNESLKKALRLHRERHG